MTISSYSYPVSYRRNKNISTSNILDPARADIGYICIHRLTDCPVLFRSAQLSPVTWQ